MNILESGGGGGGSNNPWNRNGNILAVSEQFQTEKEFQNKVFLPKLHPWKRGKKSVVVWGWRLEKEYLLRVKCFTIQMKSEITQRHLFLGSRSQHLGGGW